METVIIGAGLIGSAIAWQLARRGCAVTVVDAEQPHAASGVAAGMLAPVTEAAFTETEMIDLNRASLALFPEFAAQLQAESQLPAGLSQTPTLSVAATRDDVARLRHFAAFLTDRGLVESADLLTGRQLRSHEPLLAPGVRAGLLVPRDWSVDNRLLWTALRQAGRRRGVHRIAARVSAARSNRVTLADGRELDADVVVMAAGAWSATIDLPFRLPVRPIKGSTVRLASGPMPRPGNTVRAISCGFEVYLVPRPSGEVVIGASVDDVGFSPEVSAATVYELIRDARSVLPATAEYALTEISTGYRPAAPDHLPILGTSPADGLIVATGHYRNGVLLTPITAKIISELILDDRLPEIARPFGLERLSANLSESVHC